MMYKQFLIPDEHNHSIELPVEFFGKTVEVTVVEINNVTTNPRPTPPKGKKVTLTELFENFGVAPDFPSIEEIRNKKFNP